MPRRARIMLAGVPVHVIQRGNNRAQCFVNDEDRDFYLFHLARGLGRFGCRLHAYCLMTNHVHLLLTPKGAESCAALMKHIGQLHSQYFNKRYGRTGSLWEGRFRSCLVQSERYLLACYRYIELNPVRASLVIHRGDYPGRATAITRWAKRRTGLLRPTLNTSGSATAPKSARRCMQGYWARLPPMRGLRRSGPQRTVVMRSATSFSGGRCPERWGAAWKREDQEGHCAMRHPGTLKKSFRCRLQKTWSVPDF